MNELREGATLLFSSLFFPSFYFFLHLSLLLCLLKIPKREFGMILGRHKYSIKNMSSCLGWARGGSSRADFLDFSLSHFGGGFSLSLSLEDWLCYHVWWFPQSKGAGCYKVGGKNNTAQNGKIEPYRDTQPHTHTLTHIHTHTHTHIHTHTPTKSSSGARLGFTFSFFFLCLSLLTHEVHSRGTRPLFTLIVVSSLRVFQSSLFSCKAFPDHMGVFRSGLSPIFLAVGCQM
jgi:hypothetical protein